MSGTPFTGLAGVPDMAIWMPLALPDSRQRHVKARLAPIPNRYGFCRHPVPCGHPGTDAPF